MERKKPKLLIIGHARHGKDTFAALCVKAMGLSFVSSSEFVGRRCIWPIWGEERYASFSDCFDDRVNFRSTWYNLILSYNTPDLSRTGTEMMKDHDLYVGMRNLGEFNACKEKGIFDYVIWVDGTSRHPLEGKDSNEMTPKLADMHIDNNGPEANLHIAITNLQKRLHEEGFDVNYIESSELEIVQKPLSVTEYEAEPFNEDVPHSEEEEELLSKLMDEPLDKKYPVLLTNGRPSPKPSILDEIPSFKDEPPGWKTKPEDAIQVLDHGFFKVLEVMGSDETICESARMSYGRGTKTVSNDRGLINYLVRNGHTSPLEMGEIRFHIRMPIFVMRQWVRHRTANLNEYSGRYSEMVRLFYVPENEQICLQDKLNKQGSAEPMTTMNAENMRKTIKASCGFSFDSYEDLLKWGVSRETARMVLPLNTYTEVVWKLDISNLIKFLRLRDDDHAQWEIRQYAILVAAAVETYFPLVYDAYLEQRQSKTLSMNEIRALITKDYEFLSTTQAHKIAILRSDILT